MSNSCTEEVGTSAPPQIAVNKFVIREIVPRLRDAADTRLAAARHFYDARLQEMVPR